MPVPGIELSVELHPGVDDMSGFLFVLCNRAAPFLDDLFRLLPKAEKRSIRRNVSLDSQHFNVDLDPSLKCRSGSSFSLKCGSVSSFSLKCGSRSSLSLKCDPDPAFHFNADSDPDPAHLQSDGNLRPLTFQAFIVMDHGPARLYFEL
jgi:hypothetical protein